MRVPVCRILAVGEVSNWGKQFLISLQQENILDVGYEPDVQGFCTSLRSNLEPQILFIESVPESRNWILNLRQNNRFLYLVWYGRSFSKEDLIFAMENRIYCVLENMRPEDKRVMEWISKLANNRDTFFEFEHIIRSVKSILLQADQNDSEKQFVTEIKTALTKIERAILQNEFHTPPLHSSNAGETKLPIHKTQGVGDAISTVADLERTGVLWIKGSLPFEEGKAEFLQGKIVAANAGEVRGVKALYRMFLWDEPRFLFVRRDPKDCILEEHLNLSLKYICEEGQNLRRRYEMVRKELPPLDLRLEFEPTILHNGTSLPSADFATLASVVEYGKVSNVLDYNPQPDVHIYESLIRLKKNGLIRVALG
jgi:hypothetical protein